MEAVAGATKEPLKSDYEVAAEAAAPAHTAEPAKGRGRVWSIIYLVILGLGVFVMTKVPHQAAPQPRPGPEEVQPAPPPRPKPGFSPVISRGAGGVVVEFSK